MLEDIIKNNKYPIVFIGSGISKRYLKNFPNWEELLQSYWTQIKEEQNFYTYLRNLKMEITEPLSEDEKNFKINTEAASYIQKKFDDLFFNEEINISGLDISTAFKQNLSPFKFDIAQKFKNYEILPEMLEELEYFKIFLGKAKVIVTTNYDTLIENLLSEINYPPKVYIGQKGFFDKTLDWGELYKIHGDISDPSSIIINSKDYQKYDSNSILISAKILSNLIEAPIIFLGYSLTDRNVRKLLADFSSQLPKEDMRKTIDRIAILEFQKDEKEIFEEIMRDEVLDIGYLKLTTDNYTKIYETISKINEGLSPHEILKYQKIIKNIVIDAGKKGNLDSVLVSPSDLENIEQNIKDGKNIVVALGDKKYMYVFPDLISYMKDYLFEERGLMPAVALRFVANENIGTRTPFARYIKENTLSELDISEEERKKIERKIETLGNLDELINGIPQDCKKKYSTIEAIHNTEYGITKKINLITYNIKELDYPTLTSYILGEAFQAFEEATLNKSPLKSHLRKLFFAYDLLKHGNIKKINN